MKKTLRTILAGAVALLAVSCYDDSGLRDDIKKLDERVTALETTLNAEVASVNDLAAKLATAQTAITNLQESVGTLGTDLAALQSTVNSILPRLDAVDGETDGKIANLEAAIAALEAADDEFDTELAEAIAKIAVTKVEEKEGNVVLTLANGEEVKLSKPMSNVDNNGLVTIVKDDEGVQHWAVVGADGTTEMLPFVVGAAGTIEFKVEYNELKFTLNGEDWASTGAYVTDDSSLLLTDFYQGLTGEYDMDTYEPIKNDFYTLVFGGEEYQLPLYKVDNSTIVIKAGKTTFAYGQTKEFALNVKGISKFYVMTKPDGWKAVIDGKTLVVTAPAEANSFAEAEGEILLHANTEDGMCKIAKLGVTTKLELTIVVDEATGNVDVTSAMLSAGMMYDPMEGMIEVFNFSQIAIGMASIDLFEKDPEGYLAAVSNNELPYSEVGMIGYLDNIYYNQFDKEFEYEPGTCEVAEYHGLNVADLYEMGMYEPLPKGSKFVVWAAPVNMETYQPDPSGLVYAYYSPVVGSIELVGEPSFNEMNIKASLYGADGYYVGQVAEPYTMDYMTGELSFESYITNAFDGMNWGENALGMYVEEDGEYEYAVSKILSGEGVEAPLMQNTKYFVYVIPVTDGKAWSEYSYEKDVLPYLKEYTTASLQPGGECSVELEAGKSEYTTISANGIASEGTSQVYYCFYDPADIDKLGDKLAEDLIANGSVSIEPEFSMYQPVSAPGTQKTLVAVAVDGEGKYGELAILPIASKSITYSQTFKASLGEVSSVASGSNFSFTIPVTVEGGTAAKYYYYWSNRIRTEEEIKGNLPMGIYPYSADASLPKAFVFYSSNTQYQFAVVVESETGELSQPIIMTFDKPVVE